jgi:hypothetical protein
LAVAAAAAMRWGVVAAVGAAGFVAPILYDDSRYPWISTGSNVALDTATGSLIGGGIAGLVVAIIVALIALALGAFRRRPGFAGANASWRRVAFSAVTFGFVGAALSVVLLIRR